MDHARAAQAARESVAAPQVGDFPLSREYPRLHGDAAPQLPRRGLGVGFAVVSPVEYGRGHVDPLEATPDRPEMRPKEIHDFGVELVDEERAARPDNIRRGFGNGVA